MPASALAAPLSTPARTPKIPRSVLVVIHTQTGLALLLERRDHPGYWQSVTGSLDAPDEPWMHAAQREVQEETGIQPDTAGAQWCDWQVETSYEIYAHWRHRYAPGITHNLEHVLGLCLPAPVPVSLSAREHLSFAWLPIAQAATRCFSPSNRAALERLLAAG